MGLAGVFLTIKSSSEGEYIEKKSRFLSYAIPAGSESAIKQAIEEIKKLHPSARHIAYAYRLGASKDIWKAHDAGEPANTAGQPILGQIKSYDLTNIIVIVVRYFGGTKLGVGGLMSAYKEAASAALSKADIIEETEKQMLSFEVPYHSVSRTEYFLQKKGIEVIEKYFSESCAFVVLIPKSEFSIFVFELKSIPQIKLPE